MANNTRKCDPNNVLVPLSVLSDFLILSVAVSLKPLHSSQSLKTAHKYIFHFLKWQNNFLKQMVTVVFSKSYPNSMSFNKCEYY